jgi:hypothetical protein
LLTRDRGGVLVSLLLALSAIGCGTFGLEATVAGDAPWLMVTPDVDLVFGETSPAAKSGRQQMSIEVEGDAPVYVTDAWIESSDEDVFRISGGTLPFPRLLQPGTVMPVEIKFKPTAAGEFRGTFVVTTETGVVVERGLFGTGCADANDDGKCDR